MVDHNSAGPVLEYRRPGVGPVRRPPSPPILSVSAIGLFLLIAVALVGYPIARGLDYGWDTAAGVEVPTSRLNKYNRPAVFHIGAHGTGRGNRVVMESIYVVYTGESTAGFLSVELQEMTYKRNFYRNEGVPGRPLSRDAVVEFVVAAGFEAMEAGTITDGILKELDALAEGKLPPGTRYVMTGTGVISLGSMVHLLWLPWYTPYCLPAWLLAWWAVGRLLVRRYRRKLTQFTT